jgi:hypothetical protein
MSTDVRAGVAQLREMLPMHSPAIIQAVIESNRGDLNASLSALLSIEPDLQSSNAAPPPAPGRAAARARPPGPPAPIQHIFDFDFLRWPADAPAIREDMNGRQLSAPPPQGPTHAPVFRVASEPAPPPPPEHRKSRWSMFRSKFKKSTRTTGPGHSHSKSHRI